MATAKKGMSENSKKVLAFLKAAGVGVKFGYKEVQENLGFDKVGCVTGPVHGFDTKGLIDKFIETVEVTDEKGNTKTVEVKKFALNQKGMEYDPDAVAAE